jgi:hypothetical protein
MVTCDAALSVLSLRDDGLVPTEVALRWAPTLPGPLAVTEPPDEERLWRVLLEGRPQCDALSTNEKSMLPVKLLNYSARYASSEQSCSDVNMLG